MKLEEIEKIINTTNLSKSKWELDNIVYWDRTSNPFTLIQFFERIQTLKNQKKLSQVDAKELEYLLELLDELEADECKQILEKNEEDSKVFFIENLARTCAIETLTGGKLSYESMNTACKLSPNDFILCAKRTQDLIKAIHGLVIKGESLSKDVAGA
jgi:hypothetical protein